MVVVGVVAVVFSYRSVAQVENFNQGKLFFRSAGFSHLSNHQHHQPHKPLHQTPQQAVHQGFT